MAQKEVSSIRHDGLDGYYRCLLSVHGSRLLEILNEADAAPQSNAWYLEKLGMVEDEPERDNAELEDVPEDDYMGDGTNLSVLPSELPGGVVPDLWDRCIVTDGFGDGVKVYFDSPSVPGAEQRGFSHCQRHTCRRYRPVTSYVSRDVFAAEMFLWMRAADQQECSSMSDHLGYTPPATEVMNAIPHLTFNGF